MSEELQVMFAERFKKFLKERQITLEELALKLDITPSAPRQWSSERALPACAKLPALAELLDVSSDYLLGLSEEPKYEDRFVTAVSLDLSGQSIRVLQENKDIAATINYLLEKESGKKNGVLREIGRYLSVGTSVEAQSQWCHISYETGLLEVCSDGTKLKGLFKRAPDFVDSALLDRVRRSLEKLKKDKIKPFLEVEADDDI